MKINKLMILAIIISCLFILLFKTEWLVIAIIVKPALPLGSLITWLFVVSYSLLLYFSLPYNSNARVGKFSKRLLNYLLYLSFFWGIISYLLSGNWAFNFDNKIKFSIWIIYTAFLLLSPLFVLLFMYLRKLFDSLKDSI